MAAAPQCAPHRRQHHGENVDRNADRGLEDDGEGTSIPILEGAITDYLRVVSVWIFHKNDADPWSSILHAHHSERPLKLDAITGNIFDVRTRQMVQRLKPKELARIQVELFASKDFGERARVHLRA
jgi:hypothetical protein